MATTNTLNGALSYSVKGDGRPALLLHSSASSGSQWRDLAEELSRHCRVIVPDLIGYGRSPAGGPDRKPTLNQEAEAVVALIEGLGEPVDLIGHSFGGAIAVKIALCWPEKVRSLAIVEPVLFHLLREDGSQGRSLLLEVKTLAGKVASSVEARRPDRAMQHFIEFWNGPGAWDRLASDQRARLSQRVGQVLSNFSAAMGERWSLEACAGITCPTLAITGERTVAAARRVTEMLVEALPDVSAQTVDGAGHMAPVTHAASVNALILDHLHATERDATHAARTTDLPSAA